MAILELKFIVGSNDLASTICERFNAVYLSKIAYPLFNDSEINWNSHLKSDKPFECQVLLKGEFIGSVKMCHKEEDHFFTIEYANIINHMPTIMNYQDK